MRIQKLSIKSYKNLEDFTWEINPSYPVAVIVGKNGSGKTNLLEAIISIFQDLQLHSGNRKPRFPAFNFELVYQHQEGIVTIRNNGKLRVYLNDISVPLYDLVTLLNNPYRGGKNILPEHIFVYYAGTTNRIRNLTRRTSILFRRLLMEDPSQTELYYDLAQPLLYYEPIHYKFVFLLLLISTLPEIKKDYLEKDLGIYGFESASFTIREPRPLNTFSKEAPNKIVPPKLNSFLEFVRENAEERRPTSWAPRARFTLLPEKFSPNMIRDFGSETGLFQMLSSLHLTHYLRDIEIRFHKKDAGTVIEFDDLSDGEKQKIAVRGAMEIFRGTETLFLLDEPDTFAHPRWQWDFISDIQEAIGEKQFSQAIFITHSPLVLSTAKENAFLMEEGKIYPLQETFGQDANMSLTKMGSPEQLDEVEEDFQHYLRMIQEGQGESDRAKEERSKLEQKYGLNHPEFAKADMWISFYK